MAHKISKKLPPLRLAEFSSLSEKRKKTIILARSDYVIIDLNGRALKMDFDKIGIDITGVSSMNFKDFIGAKEVGTINDITGENPSEVNARAAMAEGIRVARGSDSWRTSKASGILKEASTLTPERLLRIL